MELQRLRHFVVLAEEMNFGRAADRLYMGQPLLSKSIQRLESTLGVMLIDRKQRQIRLTPAGHAFLLQARQALVHAELAQKMAQRVAADESAQLMLSYNMPALFDVLPRAVRAFRKSRPHVSHRLEEMSVKDQFAGLRDGTIDLGIMQPYAGDNEFESLTVARSRFMAAVPSDSELAHRPYLGVADLAGQPLIMYPRDSSAHLYDNFYQACIDAGFIPQIVQEVRSAMARLSLVACGLGISLVAESMRCTSMDGAVFIPIKGLPDRLSSALSVVWIPALLTTTSREMIETLKELSERPPVAIDSIKE